MAPSFAMDRYVSNLSLISAAHLSISQAMSSAFKLFSSGIVLTLFVKFATPPAYAAVLPSLVVLARDCPSAMVMHTCDTRCLRKVLHPSLSVLVSILASDGLLCHLTLVQEPPTDGCMLFLTDGCWEDVHHVWRVTTIQPAGHHTKGIAPNLRAGRHPCGQTDHCQSLFCGSIQ